MPAFPLKPLLVAAGLFFLPTAGISQVLNFSWPVNVGPLNPHLYTPNQMFAQDMVYEPLVRFEKDGKIHPFLAQSWEISADGKTYLFNLRKDVKFSNGEIFDAKAVKANFDAILANRSRHNWLESINQITAVKVIAPYAIQITLKENYYPFLEDLSFPRPFKFIAPSQFKNSGTKDGILSPIGTGPWKLAKTKLGEEDIFTRNEFYWGEKPDFEQINVKIIPDPNSRAMALETGQIDLIQGANGAISLDMFEQFKKSKKYQTDLSAPLGTLMVVLNTQKGPLKELAVREAIHHAVDKKSILSSVLYNTQQKAETLFAKNIPYADIDLKTYEYDPALSASLLEKSGWIAPKKNGIREKNGEKLTLALAFVGSDTIMKSISEIIQANLRQIGIDTQLIGEEESSIFARQREGNFAMIFEEVWGAPFAPAALLSSMRAPSHADYQAQLGLPDKKEIDLEIQKVLTSHNEQTRKALYKDILTRLHQEAVYLPLTYVTAIGVANDKIKNINFGATIMEIPFHQMKRGKA
ncbi:nickel ABC transporter, nickel/metallophore periplasmic binding protein [Acetobacteraceae bacterium]|nr:nickel ABC transporter, nickel/metallophore periplasmic binding protein [Acetobacteraceae bacterium]